MWASVLEPLNMVNGTYRIFYIVHIILKSGAFLKKLDLLMGI